MATKIPPKKHTKWYERKGYTEIAVGAAALITAAVVSWRLIADETTRTLGIINIISLIMLIAGISLKIIQGNIADKKEIVKQDYEGILGAMYVVHAAASHACGLKLADGLNQIRVTFHRVIFLSDESVPTEYEQLLDYIGRGGGGKYRRFSVAVGIVGRAIRSQGDAMTSKRKNTDVQRFEQELVNDWAYTAAAAKEVSRDSMSWLVVPVRELDTHRTIGMVYLDSTDANAFDDRSTPAEGQAESETGEQGGIEGIVTACLGVTNYVGMRYEHEDKKRQR